MTIDQLALRDLVADDVQAGLGEVFALSDEGLGLLDSLGDLDEPLGSEHHDVLPWQWSARHVGVLAGIPPTGREVVIRGLTVVEWRDGEPWFHRFIDWLGLFDQVGAALVTRPPVDSFPDDLPLRDRFGVLDHERVDGYGEAPST